MGVPMNHGPFRLPPRMPAQAYKTYRLDAPISTHTRPATCQEVGCEPYQHGWATTVLPGSQDEAVVKASGRHWSSVEVAEGGFLRYTFPPGQPCFRASVHRAPLEREPIFSVVAGDHRVTQPEVLRRHTSAESWVDDFATHQQTIADAIERG